LEAEGKGLLEEPGLYVLHFLLRSPTFRTWGQKARVEGGRTRAGAIWGLSVLKDRARIRAAGDSSAAVEIVLHPGGRPGEGRLRKIYQKSIHTWGEIGRQRRSGASKRIIDTTVQLTET